jgi:hypothetical protein
MSHGVQPVIWGRDANAPRAGRPRHIHSNSPANSFPANAVILITPVKNESLTWHLLLEKTPYVE